MGPIYIIEKKFEMYIVIVESPLSSCRIFSNKKKQFGHCVLVILLVFVVDGGGGGDGEFLV